MFGSVYSPSCCRCSSRISYCVVSVVSLLCCRRAVVCVSSIVVDVVLGLLLRFSSALLFDSSVCFMFGSLRCVFLLGALLCLIVSVLFDSSLVGFVLGLMLFVSVSVSYLAFLLYDSFCFMFCFLIRVWRF